MEFRPLSGARVRGRPSDPPATAARYQSRVGPGKWLEPSLDATLHNLAAQGAKTLLIIPIAFVSDHVETLHEIDIEARALAQSLGIREFGTMPALNDSPTFIRALADLVLKAVGVEGQ